MKFEIGKYYKHNDGNMLHIVGKVYTTMFGETLVAENSMDVEFIQAVGNEEWNAVNYVEVNKEEWDKEFNDDEV